MTFQSFDIGGNDIAGRLGEALGTGLESGFQSRMDRLKELQKQEGKQMTPQQSQMLTDTLIQKGVDPRIAQLWPLLTEGGRTKAGEFAVEDIVRGGQGLSQQQEDMQNLPRGSGLLPKEESSRAFERNKKYFENISEKSQSLPKERVAIAQMKNALLDKNFNSYRNAIAEMTGLEALKTASAQTVNSAAKQFLIAELASLTGRPNQFIEKQITKALISPLYKDEANQAIYEGIEGLSNLKEREIEIAEQLEEAYSIQGREVPRNFQKLVRDRLKKETKAFEEAYQNRLEELFSSKSKKSGEVEMIAPDGSSYAIPKKDVKAAQESGYKLKR